MKRYYITPDAHPHEYIGQHHHIHLASHGPAGEGFHVTVVMDDDLPVPADWEELPELLDPATTLGHPDHARHLAILGDLAALPTHNGYALAKHLAKIHPLFKP